jgi:hypothetical protein
MCIRSAAVVVALGLALFASFEPVRTSSQATAADVPTPAYQDLLITAISLDG